MVSSLLGEANAAADEHGCWKEDTVRVMLSQATVSVEEADFPDSRQ